MPLDIGNRKIGGDHPRLREPGSFPPWPTREDGGFSTSAATAPMEIARRDRIAVEHKKACSPRNGYSASSLSNSRSAAQTFGRTASFTVIFAFFLNSAMVASTCAFPFSFRNAARICSLTMARGIFFPFRTIDAACSA